MADTVDTTTRSRIMRRVRSKDTGPEMLFRRALWARGVRGWRCHVKNVPGTPDLAWSGRKIAVFIDSAWWHGHSSRWQPGRLSRKWDEKILGNKARDERVNQELAKRGWNVMRFWDFELESDISACVEVVAEAVENSNA